MPLQPVGTNVIVRPLYDPEKVETGLSPGAPALYMPGTGRNPMSQQGIVESVGPRQEVIHSGDHILYHPFVQHPFHHEGMEYLMVAARHIVGKLDSEGILLPLPWDLVIRPDFEEVGRPVKKGPLWLPNQVFDTSIPCTGRVVRRGCECISVHVGDRVLFPPEVGNEIGLRQVYYTIPEKEILGVLATALPVTVMTPAVGRNG
jgi:co-chaperonin GroES (HSP10)